MRFDLVLLAANSYVKNYKFYDKSSMENKGPLLLRHANITYRFLISFMIIRKQLVRFLSATDIVYFWRHILPCLVEYISK